MKKYDRYVPRSILVDLESKVIDRIRTGETSRFFNPENLFVPTVTGGGGAGNNWASGYDAATKVSSSLFDIIDREADGCDNLEGFIICHSISGGTGSGFGSHLLEQLSSRYPHKVIQTYSVFPSNNDMGVGEVSHYNSVLTLKRLEEVVDSVIVLDNAALNHIAEERLKMKNPSMDDLNAFITSVISSSTATLRFPSYMNNDLVSLLSSLIPTPRCHFLMTAYTPFTSTSNTQAIRRTNVMDVLRRLLHPHHTMVSTSTKRGFYSSLLAIIQGTASGEGVDQMKIHQSLQRIKERRLIRFIPWSPASFQITVARRSQFVEQRNRISGLLLANHTNIRSLLKRILDDFQKVFRRNAYLSELRKYPALKNDDEFNEADETVRQLIQEYKAMETESYPTWTPTTADSASSDPRMP